MTIQTQTLAEFVLARVAEDEAGATEHTFTPSTEQPLGEVFTSGSGRMYADPHHTIDVTDEYARWVESLPLSDRARRTLAECEAKRRIVEHCEAVAVCDIHGKELANGCEGCSVADNVGLNDAEILRLLALPYADHPHFREEWRP